MRMEQVDQRMRPGRDGQRSLTLFIAVAFLLPLIAAVMITLLEGRPAMVAIRKLSFSALVAIGTMILAPTIAAVVAAFKDEGLGGVKALLRPLLRWRAPLYWYALSVFLFPVTILVTLFILSFFAQELAPAFGLTLLPLAGLFSTLCEEVGWTGYATPTLLKKTRPLKVGLILGAIEALWHLPADLWGSGAFHGSDFVMHFVFASIAIIGFRVVAVWIYTHTQSLLLCWFAHAGFKCGQLLFVPHNISSEATIIWQVAFMIAMVCVALLVVLWNNRISIGGR